MKRFILYFLFFISSYFTHAQVTITPSSFNVGDPITITVSMAAQSCNLMGTSPTKVYMHAGIGNDANAFGFSVVGNWGQDNNVGLMTNNGNGTWSITLTPSVYFGLNATQQANATKLGMVFRNANGSQTLKLPPTCGDFIFNVGSFQVNLTAPVNNSSTIINSGGNFNITANNTGGIANYNLKANGVSINTSSTSSYAFNHTNITTNTSYELEVTLGSTTITRRFSVIVNPTVISQAIPAGMLDGINYSSDHTKATLVLNAPFKDFVYVAGNFNNWQPTTNHLMKKDPATGKFWLEITGLTPEQWYAFQYWVCDDTNVPANSPKIVKTADPFSTLVLSPFDDPEIITLGVYPGLPVYNTIAPGQEREVSVIQTGVNTFRTYNWSAATLNFQKPAIKDLVFYEVLVRDFDSNRTYQDLIDKLNYFKNLNINAIKLMPVMEFEGNLSWGYNTAYHLALDKRYGPPAKLKQFIDLCHQNGIAVVLDIALNHAFGRSPLERMWMLDTNDDGWSDGYPRVTSENPYVNRLDAHSYSVGSDLNHFRESGPGGNLTNTYVIRTLQHWIQEFKIDGYRWDLTKGFTNQCPPDVAGGQDACTNQYRSDRVGKMKWYADKQWEADNTSFVIFEHLGIGGSRTEELEWANYRAAEGKGVMFWHKLTDDYSNLIKGNANGISNVTIFGDNNRAIGYAESHDEERVIYKAITEAGQTQGNLAKALQRLSAQGAVHLLVPGPKMIWHFGELGWDKSLWTCTNGNVSFSNPDCKLDTKPQPQWTENWMANAARSTVYNNWAKMIKLRIDNPVFENGQFSWNMTNSSRPRLDIWTSTSQTPSLSYVIVLTNFTDSAANLGGFPFTGNWVNLMDNSTINVTTTGQTLSIEAGGFRVFGNQPSTLSSEDFNAFKPEISIYPNPVKNSFAINQAVSSVEVYTITGQLVASYNSVAANQELLIDGLESGIYLVKMKDQNNFIQTKKIVIE
jgi:1,4-alpha-glucan branching enzyme